MDQPHLKSLPYRKRRRAYAWAAMWRDLGGATPWVASLLTGVLAAGMAPWFDASQKFGGAARVAAIGVGAAIATMLTFFLVEYFLAPARMDAEKEADLQVETRKRQSAEGKNAQRVDHVLLGQNLSRLATAGTALIEEIKARGGASMELTESGNAQIGAWRERFEQWRGEIKAVLVEHHLEYRFGLVDSVPFSSEVLVAHTPGGGGRILGLANSALIHNIQGRIKNFNELLAMDPRVTPAPSSVLEGTED